MMPQNESQSFLSILYLFNKKTPFSFVSYLNFKESAHEKKKLISKPSAYISALSNRNLRYRHEIFCILLVYRMVFCLLERISWTEMETCVKYNIYKCFYNLIYKKLCIKTSLFHAF